MTTYIRENANGLYTEFVEDGEPECLVTNATDHKVELKAEFTVTLT